MIKLKSLDEFINETSLSRVWKHFNSDKTVVILTAFRGDNEMSKNISDNKSIASEFKKNKFGYFFVDGFWIENKGESDERKVSEDSIFVIANKEDSEKLISLANKYKQDAIFVKTDVETYLLFKNGSKEKLAGGLQPNKIGEFYTKLRNNKKSNTFVFEGARENYGFFGNFASKIQKGK
jgi:hypothetical protein